MYISPTAKRILEQNTTPPRKYATNERLTGWVDNKWHANSYHKRTYTALYEVGLGVAREMIENPGEEAYIFGVGYRKSDHPSSYRTPHVCYETMKRRLCGGVKDGFIKAGLEVPAFIAHWGYSVLIISARGNDCDYYSEEAKITRVKNKLLNGVARSVDNEYPATIYFNPEPDKYFTARTVMDMNTAKWGRRKVA